MLDSVTGSNEGDAWLLTQLKLEGNEAAEWLCGSDRCTWMMVGNIPINQLLQEDNFAFSRIEELQGQSPMGGLRAHFIYEQSPSGLSQNIKSGYIDFDSTHSYRPMSYQFDIKSELEEGVIRGTLEYESVEGIPIPKLMTQLVESRTKRKGLIRGKEIHTFSDVKYNVDVPKEKFRLAYYGLPEPAGTKRPTLWYVWAALAGVVCLVLAALFRWMGRRKGRSIAHPGA